MTEQLATFVEMMAYLDLDAYMPLPEPHRQTFHKLKRLRAHAQAGDNQALILEMQNENQPDEIVRIFAASMIVAAKVNPEQLEILGRYLQADKNHALRITLAKKLRDVPLELSVSWLLQALINSKDAQFRVIAAESVQSIGTDSWERWQEKVETLLRFIEESDQYREHLDIATIVKAVLPPHRLILIPEDRYRLADYLIRKAPKYNNDPRLTGILAAFIIQCFDHNLHRVVQRVNRFTDITQENDNGFVLLRTEINSLLTPAELKSTLSAAYQAPLKVLQEDVRSKWKTSVFSAQIGLGLRLFVSFLASGIGLWLLYKGAGNLSDQATWPVSFLQIGLGLILLLIFLIHRGPVRDTRQTLVDIGVANTVYATFTQQSLDISHRYSALSLQNQLTATEMQTSNKLLSEAMKHAVRTLRSEKPFTLDELLEQNP